VAVMTMVDTNGVLLLLDRAVLSLDPLKTAGGDIVVDFYVVPYQCRCLRQTGALGSAALEDWVE